MTLHLSDEALQDPVELRAVAPTKAQIRQAVRRQIAAELYDESAGGGSGTAIYTLSDPQDLRLVRYVGQTRAPKGRFRQHLNSARLWLPDALPWWVKSPKLRPLYQWIRELYRDDGRLPTMIVREWQESPSQVRAAERGRICECLAQGLPLLNYEAEILIRQLRLL